MRLLHRGNPVSFLLTALALTLALSACGGGGGGDSSGDAGSYDTSLAQAVSDAGAFSEQLDPLDADTGFYLFHLADAGIQREELADCAILCSSGGTCEQVAVLQFPWAEGKAEERQAQVMEALQSYIDGQIEANVNYRPDEIPKLENALIQQKGDSFLLIVASDLEAAKGAIQ